MEMFNLFKMPKRRTFGHFLTSSEDKLFFIEKEDMSSKKKTYGNPTGTHCVEFTGVDYIVIFCNLRPTTG